MKPFWYEQTDLGDEHEIDAIYKFDPKRGQDVHWRRLNQNGKAMCRELGPYYQVVIPDDDATEDEVNELLTLINLAGPLDCPGSPEVLIRKTSDGFEMTSHWIHLGPGAPFRAFNPQEWNAAYRRLDELERQQNEPSAGDRVT